jgi:hypothetical protein
VERAEKDRTQGSLTAGTSKSEDNQQLADRLNAEFDQKLAPGPRSRVPLGNPGVYETLPGALSSKHFRAFSQNTFSLSGSLASFSRAD